MGAWLWICGARWDRISPAAALPRWFDGALLTLADHAPGHAAALRSLAARLVDLLPVARRHYYHRDMRGSWSIKAVLPTLAPELDYRTLEGARSGADAQELYLEALDPCTTEARHHRIEDELLAYCERDTLAMVVVLERLCGQQPARATRANPYQERPEGAFPS
jgi:hypothetical protein